MSLLKIWNSLRGRSTEDDGAEDVQETRQQPAKAKLNARKPSRGILRRDAHGSLRRLVKPLSAASVLQISVGDGSAAVAALQTLAGKDPLSVRYAAIDEFELGGGPLSLKEFHQRLRQLDIRPQLFPDSIERGLVRVANTIGPVDLILIAAPAEAWQTPTAEPLLGRVTHASTVILHLNGQQWCRFEPSSQNRAAA